MSDDETTDPKHLESGEGAPVPDKAADTPATRTDDDPRSADLAQHTGGGRVPELSAADAEPVQIGERRGMFGATRGQDTTGYGGLVTPTLMPGASPRPYGSFFDEVADTLAVALADGTGYESAVERVVVDRGEMTLFVRREHLLEVAHALRDHPGLRFEMCLGVSGVHYPGEAGRELHAAYPLLSITHGSRRIRVEVTCPDSDPHIPSVVEVWPGNDWHERETWDMFGIEFDGHPALTRVLMPDDWPGHPQRKDYPLGGIPVEYKGGTVPPPDERRAYT
ncbi:NADH-quinone oxidoreductase subunit C [Phycicoccus endophyticus]|uniref:NADH-quinone oxidoreductase subunit C n=1 Tax=Phycicoccus endophyticus TaxID=1690220 RepID=A0A7G9QZH6_9MICO|nr:NADH-quinone oxidoreductase subunit C [Phycicoccus endophyticus]QNN48751.1 NADH-quinone oxidoreductase subunit C [Phycicoccus endophyticus]GGL32874.1 NADH-quinone oxidoreductase subunit C [Phycicoccus endophyticus]